ncbi:hypothetical protein SDC9_109609 [bioreactor metagenome]|uniref:Uncharacterized protein n=1 Tax=bioreactor metagenome TaxID=1076179 RepID=A0A645BBN7_9ZZZZ
MMNIDRAAFENHRIAEFCIVAHIVEGINIVAGQSPRFSFTQQIRHPGQLNLSVFGQLLGIVEGTVNGFEHMIADRFCIINLTEIVAGILPVPFPFDGLMAFGDRHRPRNLRKN